MDNDRLEFQITPELLEQLRAPKILGDPYDRCLCRKMLNVTEYQRKWHSGRWSGGKMIEPGVNYTDLLCEDCRKEFAHWPRIVCLGCRKLMGFYRPGKQATGFVFEKDRHYHILQCPRCNPKIHATPVMEHEQFCRARGIPTDTDLDLIKEIEQKILKAEQEAAKFKAEFENRPASQS
jgi:hypothetical protein